jgi:hypothetical protein
MDDKNSMRIKIGLVVYLELKRVNNKIKRLANTTHTEQR